MRVAWWLDKARNTHSEYVEHIRFSTTTTVTHFHNYVISISTLPVIFFCLSSQTVHLMNIRQQNYAQNVQTHIFLTKYISIKPIHTSNNVQHTSQQS